MYVKRVMLTVSEYSIIVNDVRNCLAYKAPVSACQCPCQFIHELKEIHPLKSHAISNSSWN